MKQLLTRIDDALHARLKERARSEGVSVNTYVTEVIEAALAQDDAKARLRDRLHNAGRLVVYETTGAPPGRDVAIAQLRGAADVVLGAIEAGRAPR